MAMTLQCTAVMTCSRMTSLKSPGYKVFKVLSTHVAGRLPKPWQNGTMLGVHFSEPLNSCEDKISIKKGFLCWPSEIAANMHSQYGPSRLDWPHMLSAISEGQKWKTFLCSFCLYMGIEVKKVYS